MYRKSERTSNCRRHHGYPLCTRLRGALQSGGAAPKGLTLRSRMAFGLRRRCWPRNPCRPTVNGSGYAVEGPIGPDWPPGACTSWAAHFNCALKLPQASFADGAAIVRLRPRRAFGVSAARLSSPKSQSNARSSRSRGSLNRPTRPQFEMHPRVRAYLTD